MTMHSLFASPLCPIFTSKGAFYFYKELEFTHLNSGNQSQTVSHTVILRMTVIMLLTTFSTHG